jgi:hypothetical protein
MWQEVEAKYVAILSLSGTNWEFHSDITYIAPQNGTKELGKIVLC